MYKTKTHPRLMKMLHLEAKLMQYWAQIILSKNEININIWNNETVQFNKDHVYN